MRYVYLLKITNSIILIYSIKLFQMNNNSNVKLFWLILIQDTISINCDKVIDQSISNFIILSKSSFDDIFDTSWIANFVNPQMSSNKIKKLLDEKMTIET